MKKAAAAALLHAFHVEEARTASPAGVVVGVVMGTHDGHPIVSWGEGRGPRPAASVWFPTAPDWAACCGVRVLVGFLDGEATKPIVVGFLECPPLAAEEAKHLSRPAAWDSKVLKIESDEELILECGKAKISLRADGKVTILGGTLISRSTGVNKIQGGSVRIN